MLPIHLIFINESEDLRLDQKKKTKILISNPSSFCTIYFGFDDEENVNYGEIPIIVLSDLKHHADISRQVLKL